MAPLPSEPSIDLPTYLSSLSISEREALANPDSVPLFKRDAASPTTFEQSTATTSVSTSTITANRVQNNTHKVKPGSGSIAPSEFNNKGIQALFALIGVSFVVVGIWFFFWAKNGGFQWRRGDWDDYKSTVLRRKGPNGTTLSNATKSTRLGGGSVVGQGYSDRDGAETVTDLSSEAPVIKEKQRAKKSKKAQKAQETAKDRKIREVQQSGWEGGHDNDVRAYRHERVAKVGGLNRDSDAQFYGSDFSRSPAPSATHHHSPRHSQQHQQRESGNHSRHASPEKPSRNGTPNTPSRYHSPNKNSGSGPKAPPHRSNYVPGGFADPSDFSDVQSQNTRSYHHPIPGLSGGQGASGGFRRGRDEFDD